MFICLIGIFTIGVYLYDLALRITYEDALLSDHYKNNYKGESKK